MEYTTTLEWRRGSTAQAITVIRIGDSVELTATTDGREVHLSVPLEAVRTLCDLMNRAIWETRTGRSFDERL